MLIKTLKILIINLFISAIIIKSGSLYAQKQINFISDAEAKNFLVEISKPIISAAKLNEDSISFYIIDDNSLNAFVAGGQNIFIHSGLIIGVETTSQLQGVIAHEMGHISGGHLARNNESVKNAQAKSYAGLALGILAAILGRPDAAITSILAGQQFAGLDFLSHTREQENQADQAAINYLKKSGLPTRGLENFLNKLKNEENIYGSNYNPYYRSHPITTDRIASIRARNNDNLNLKEKKSQSHKLKMLQAKFFAWINTFERTIKKYPLNKKDSYSTYAHAVTFYKIKKYDIALTYIDSLIQQEPDNPYFLELKAQILNDLGKTEENNKKVDEAIITINNALSINKNEEDFMFLETKLLMQRSKDNDIKKANKNLEYLTQEYKFNSYYWSLYAANMSQLGDEIGKQWAASEAYYTLGQFKNAKETIEKVISKINENDKYYYKLKDLLEVVNAKLKNYN